MKWLIDIILEQFSGIIMIWSGLIANIPDGWILCDGDNGTPDLRTRFIVGASPDEEPGVTGGTNLHQHTFTSNTHRHEVPTEMTADGAEEGEILCGTENGPIETSLVAVTGNTNSMSHVPPYYRILFIMKT